MANTQTTTFKGARYITKFADPIEWDNTRAYEAIEAVQHNGFTYISKQPVPTGVLIDNEEFWLLWADPNAQMEQLRQLVEEYADVVTQWGDELNAEITTIEKAHVFDTVADMKNGENLKVGAICHTNGFRVSGDGGAAWYEITDSGTANEMDVIACGELFANLVIEESFDLAMLGASINENDNSQIIIHAFEIANLNTVNITCSKFYPISNPVKTIVKRNVNADIFVKALNNMDYCIWLESENDNLDTLFNGTFTIKCDCNWLANDGLYVDGGLGSIIHAHIYNCLGYGVDMRHTRTHKCAENTVYCRGENVGHWGTAILKCGQDDIYPEICGFNFLAATEITTEHAGGNIFGLIHTWNSGFGIYNGGCSIRILANFYNSFNTIITDGIQSTFELHTEDALNYIQVKQLWVYGGTIDNFQYLFSFVGISKLTNSIKYLIDIYAAVNYKKLYNYLPYILIDGIETSPIDLDIQTRRFIQIVKQVNVTVDNFDDFVCGNAFYNTNGTLFSIKGWYDRFSHQEILIPALKINGKRTTYNNANFSGINGIFKQTTIQTLNAQTTCDIAIPNTISLFPESFAFISMSNYNNKLVSITPIVSNNVIRLTFSEAITETIRISIELTSFKIDDISFYF